VSDPIPARQKRDRWSWEAELLSPLVVAAVDARQLRQLCEMWGTMRWGISSASMVRNGIIGAPVPQSCYPRDWADLERCEIAYAISPRWLKPKIADTLGTFRLHVVGKNLSWAPPVDMFRASLGGAS
jgi:hypothetical protein